MPVSMLINKRGIPVYVCINYNPGINFRTLSQDKIHHAVPNRIIIAAAESSEK